MSYEFSYQVIEDLSDSYGLLTDLAEQDELGYPAEVQGMRTLDYMPDMDDFEYLQSCY